MMAKRFAALLLAICLAMTCALGAWAEEPVQTGDGQDMETVAGSEEPSGEDTPVPAENAADPAESQPTNEEGPAPEGDENTSDGNASQADKPDGGESDSSEANKGEPEQNNGDTVDGAPNGGTGTQNGDADGQDGSGNADVNTLSLDNDPIPLSLSEEEWQEKAQQVTILCDLYGANGNPIDRDNIAPNDVITVYYVPGVRSGNMYTPCTLEDFKRVLGATKVSAYSTVDTDNGSAKDASLLDPPKTLYQNRIAYWQQEITATEEGDLHLSLYLTATVQGDSMQKFVTGYNCHVREKHRGDGAKKLLEALGGISVNRADTADPSDHQATVGQTFKLQLETRRDDYEGNLEDYITSKNLEPDAVSVTWQVPYGGTQIFKADDADDKFQLYDPVGKNTLGSQSFTVTAIGNSVIEFSVLYEGDLVMRCEFNIYGRYNKQIPLDDAKTFPDENLRTALQKYDTGVPDGKIDLDTEFHGYLDLSGCGITDLTGLEEFEDLQSLIVDKNNLTTLDVVSELKNLRTLSFYKNNITDLDVSALQNLQTLNCSNNALKVLDVSQNKDLENLYCSLNQLETLTVSGNTKLVSLDCSGNRLQTLDVGSNAKLQRLYCNRNRLEALEVSGNQNLVALNCADNYLTELVLTANTKLQELYVSNNRMPMLDLSANENISDDTTDLGSVLQGIFGMQNVDVTFTSDGSNCTVELPAGVDGSKITVRSLIDRDTTYSVSGNQVEVPEGEEGMLVYEYQTHGPGNAGTMVVWLNARLSDWKRYEIVEGDKPSIVVDGKSPLTVVTNIPKNKIREIYLAGMLGPIPADQFRVDESGSDNTKITIAASYLRQLMTGYTYTLTIYADDGEASTTVYVIANTAPLPPENNNSGDTDADADDTAPAKENEYIVCKACGHQTWEPYLEGWRCTNCGYLRGTTGVPVAYRGKIPQTADEFPLESVAAVFCVSLAGLGALLLLRKKQK